MGPPAHPSIPAQTVAPTGPTHHPPFVFDIIFNAAARSLGALYLALMLLLWGHDLWLLRRPLLGARNTATRNNNRKHREHQNACLHFDLFRATQSVRST